MINVLASYDVMFFHGFDGYLFLLIFLMPRVDNVTKGTYKQYKLLMIGWFVVLPSPRDLPQVKSLQVYLSEYSGSLLSILFYL